jgi:hypothetical protein
VCVCVPDSSEWRMPAWQMNCVFDCFDSVAMSIRCGKKKFRKLNLYMLCMSVAMAVLSVCLPVYIHSRALSARARARSLRNQQYLSAFQTSLIATTASDPWVFLSI